MYVRKKIHTIIIIIIIFKISKKLSDKGFTSFDLMPEN